MFFKLLSNVCNIDEDSLDDNEFMKQLSNRTEKRHDNVMKEMKSQKGEARGSRTVKQLMTCQAIYDMWHDFLMVTVDR